MDDWDQLIDNVLFAYRSSPHDSTRWTPFLLMYGREAHLPIDLTRVLQQETMDEPDLETKIAKMIEFQKKLHDQAREIVERAQQRQRRQFDAKHNSLTKLLTSSSLDHSIVIPVLRYSSLSCTHNYIHVSCALRSRTVYYYSK